jgi:inosine/xanthosine triphosphate pyrophosphatase family protein
VIAEGEHHGESTTPKREEDEISPTPNRKRRERKWTVADLQEERKKACSHSSFF